MKQIYFICGNVAAGKSTLISRVKAEYPTVFDFFSIDDFRIEYSNGSLRGENNAWGMLYEKIKRSTAQKIIVESSGTSKHISEIHEKLLYLGYPFVTILLECEIEECLQRLSLRTKPEIPFPYKYTLAQSAEWMSQEIKKITFDATIKSMQPDKTFRIFCRMLRIPIG
jgi:predicted kinase